jgi:hypothetical protein
MTARCCILRLREGVAVAASLLLAGCCSCPSPRDAPRPFQFQHDTVAFANELRWDYRFNSEGRWVGTPRQPAPEYSNHCFMLARAAKQFFWNAKFAPEQPKLSGGRYEQLIHKVIRSSARRPLPPERRVVIPGYADLYAFSQDWEAAIKEATGGSWRSYVQRGHWRMIFPFSKRHQKSTALRLARAARTGSPVVVHLVDFPGLRINHALVVFGMEETRDKLFFEAYDPNEPGWSCWLTYDQRAGRFLLPSNSYFPGGRVKVYEVYCGAWY